MLRAQDIKSKSFKRVRKLEKYNNTTLQQVKSFRIIENILIKIGCMKDKSKIVKLAKQGNAIRKLLFALFYLEIQAQNPSVTSAIGGSRYMNVS